MGGKRPGRFREGNRRNRTFGPHRRASAITATAGRMDRYGCFQEIRDSLSDWQSLARPRGMDRQFMGARAMSQRAGAAESEFKALIEAWAVRRHDLPAILAHHVDDIAMFDVPPSLQSRGLAEYRKTWDLFFAYRQPWQAFDVEELQMCVGDTVAFAVALMRCGRLPVSADHGPSQGSTARGASSTSTIRCRRRIRRTRAASACAAISNSCFRPAIRRGKETA
jgi:ketosteroid isomerase-like protein